MKTDFGWRALFLLSGGAALVYQVVWQRMLSLSAGSGVRSMAIVVGAFMLGLGLGSEAGGRIADRLSPARALQAFALVEAALAAFGAASPFLYYDLLYVRLDGGAASLAGTAVVQLLALLPPTALMGASLPLLVRGCVGSAADAPARVTGLFAANVLGSALGAVATPWILLTSMSMTAAAGLAAGLNASVAAGALILRPAEGTLNASTPGDPGTPPPRADVAFWCALFGVSGFVALGLEMIWFRVIDVSLKGTAFTFGTVLGLYLLGLAIGARLPQPRSVAPMRAFAALQLAVVGWAAGSALVVAYAPSDWPGVGHLLGRMVSYRGRLGPAADAPTFATFVLAPALYFLPATIAMGASFAALQKAIQTDASGAALRTGRLQAANIAGSLLGSLVVGLILLEMIGTSATLKSLAVVGAFASLAAGVRAGSRKVAVAAISVGAMVVGAVPANEELWRRLHGRSREGSIFEEDSAAVVALIRNRFGGYRLTVNGAGHSELPYGGTHTLLGALTVALHNDPREVAIVGLGSGNTAWAALAHPGIARATVFEIAPAQRPALVRLEARGEFPELRALLSDPRVAFRFDDGRRGLERGADRFDVIEIDALYPWAAWSGNIYSVEFFELCRDRLKPGGLLVTWAPTARIKRSVVEAFPHVRAYLGDFLVASTSPLPGAIADATILALRARLGEKTVDDLDRMVRESRVLERGPGEVNRDLRPRDEFTGPGGFDDR